MTRVEPGKMRSSVTEGPQGLEVVIPSKKNVFLFLFLTAWLVGWAYGELRVPVSFLKGNAGKDALIFSVVWLTAWTLGGGFAITIWLWNIAGKERIRVNTVSLSVKREIFGHGVEKEFDMVHVRNLRVSAQPSNPFSFAAGLQLWGVGGGVIAFDYGASTYRFGNGVEEAEAGQLLTAIKERYTIQ